jgi:hypothetical protein
VGAVYRGLADRKGVQLIARCLGADHVIDDTRRAFTRSGQHDGPIIGMAVDCRGEIDVARGA